MPCTPLLRLVVVDELLLLLLAVEPPQAAAVIASTAKPAMPRELRARIRIEALLLLGLT
jgi:hypothetical protein